MADKGITFVIKKHLGVLSEGDKGWKKELNIVSWNDGPTKYDIREWNEDHDKMSRGITLYGDEMEAIVDAVVKCNSKDIVKPKKD